MPEDCLFCKIIAKESPADFLYEDDRAVVFLDIYPNAPGHALVVPRNHTSNFLDTSTEDLNHMVEVVRRVTPAIKEAFGYEGFNVLSNNGEAAGQFIKNHAHWHIIPRKKGDELMKIKSSTYEEGQAAEVAQKIREKLA